MSFSWPDVAVPLLLILSWLVIFPFPLQVLSWNRHNRRSKHAPDLNSKNENTLSSSKEAKQVKGEDIEPGYILPVMIHHARMLPKESQHAFRYPSIFLALNSQDLENGKTELNRVFSYTSLQSGWSISKLDPNGFGRRVFPGIENDSHIHQCLSQSIYLKLMFELRLRGYVSAGPQDVSTLDDILPWKKEVGQVWAIAMPSLLGMGGFNPLTIYYVYRPREEDGKGRVGNLWLVVLEVHNTFNERHIYVCEVGVKEDVNVIEAVHRRGYTHSWTFAREFHVSPFNDRSGYYQLLMSNLWANGSEHPVLDIRLLLLTEDSEGEKVEELPGLKRRKKLLATLTSSQAKSNSLKPSRVALAMTSKNMIKSLLSQPFDLILPVSRIMWQASKLHWKRKLPVFIRPEPRGQGLKDQVEQQQKQDHKSGDFNGVGWPIDLNPTQQKVKQAENSSPSGAIYWNQDGSLETACFKQFEMFVRKQTLTHDDMCLCIVSRNAEVQPLYYYRGDKVKELIQEASHHLTLYTLSSSIFLDFALYTPNQARLFGSEQDRSWGVSSLSNFERLFDSLNIEAATDKPKGWRNATAAWARRKHLQWSINLTAQSPAFDNNDKSRKVARQLLIDVTNLHPYNSIDNSFAFLIALLVQIFIIHLTAFLSTLIHISYVRPPWAQVGEGYRKLVAAAAAASQ